MKRRFVLLFAAQLAANLGPSVPAFAAKEPSDTASESTAKDRPTVKLDRLDMSKVPGAVAEQGFIKDTLIREARHVDWGLGRGSRVEFRFRLDELSVTESPGLLRVRCSATGWLPKGKVAKSHLTFGGAPKDREKLVHHVLEIVSRGVVTRLADLERARRS
jgi:hypothetical protein